MDGHAALTAPRWMPGSPILAGNQVILLWTPVSGAVKYNVYLNGEKVKQTPSIQLILPAPEKAGAYQYSVAAVDASSVEGAMSSTGSIKVFKLEPPKNINVRMINENVGIHWDPVPGAVLYNLYRSTEKDKGYTMVASLQDVRWTDSKIEKNKKYFYKVTAKDAAGKESGKSDVAVVSTEVRVVAEEKGETLVVGLRTKPVFELADKDFTDKGLIKIHNVYDVEPSMDYTIYYISSVYSRAVLMMNEKGEYLGQFGDGPSKDDGNFQSPYGIGIGPDGMIYVVDSAKNNIQVFSPKGIFQKVFAKVTKKDWMHQDPKLQDVAIDRDGDVYALDYKNAAVIIFNSRGKEIGHFKKRGLPKGDESGFPTYLKIVKGNLLMADGARGRVLVLEKSTGKTLRQVGQKGSGVGKLMMMGGFDVSDDGKVYCVDMANQLIQVYGLSDGKYLYTLANEKNDGPMPVFTPVVISVQSDKSRLIVAEALNNSLRGFEMFGKPESSSRK